MFFPYVALRHLATSISRRVCRTSKKLHVSCHNIVGTIFPNGTPVMEWLGIEVPVLSPDSLGYAKF